jgi:hypothetical protein
LAIPDYLERSAVNKALLALKNETVNLATNFAERRQLDDLVVDTVKRVANTVSSFRKTRPKDWAKVVGRSVGQALRGGKDTIPQAWLETQYAWNPLLQDVKSAQDHLAKREGDNKSYTASVHASAKDTQSFVYRKQFSGSREGYCVGYVVPVTQSDQVYVRLDYFMENPLLSSLKQLGLTNPAELVWEELPYSFVIDWFLPVGNYLSAFDADLGWSFRGGSISYSSKAKGFAATPTSEDPGVSFLAYEPFSWVNNLFNRAVYGESPGPQFPPLKNPLKSTLHVSEALSLLVQVFR